MSILVSYYPHILWTIFRSLLPYIKPYLSSMSNLPAILSYNGTIQYKKIKELTITSPFKHVDDLSVTQYLCQQSKFRLCSKVCQCWVTLATVLSTNPAKQLRQPRTRFSFAAITDSRSGYRQRGLRPKQANKHYVLKPVWTPLVSSTQAQQAEFGFTKSTRNYLVFQSFTTLHDSGGHSWKLAAASKKPKADTVTQLHSSQFFKQWHLWHHGWRHPSYRLHIVKVIRKTSAWW